MGTTGTNSSYRSRLTGSGSALLRAFPHPFPVDGDGSLRPDAVPIEREVPAGGTIDAVLEASGALRSMPGYAGMLVTHNGRVVEPEQYGNQHVAPGDKLVAIAVPRDPFTVGLFAASTLINLQLQGVIPDSILSSLIEGGAFDSTLIGELGIIPSPPEDIREQETRVGRRISPSLQSPGNRLLPDHPVFITCGDVRVHAPHLAVPFQPGFVGGADQEPSLRLLLGVGGDCIISEVRQDKIAAELLDIEFTTFQNQQTINFPTAAVKRPGITLRDKFVEGTITDDNPSWEIVATDNEVDELSLTYMLQQGLRRIDEAGETEPWQVSLDIEYRVPPAGAWTGFFAEDAGTSARHRSAFAIGLQEGGDNRYHLVGRTAEPFFFYLQRTVPRARYEVRFRLRPEPNILLPEAQISNYDDGKPLNRKNTGQKLDKAKWPRDRWPDETEATRGNTDTHVLFTDPLLVQFAAFRDEPAVENFTPGLSGLEIQLNDQTTKGDAAARISFRCQRQIPELSGGARTAPTTTSNPAAIALDLLTGTLCGDSPVPDSKINFPLWQVAFDYCNELIPKPQGGTEKRHLCDAVLDRDGVGRLEIVRDILRNCRMTLGRMNGQYYPIIDQKKTAPRTLFTDATIEGIEIERTHPITDDVLRVSFFNGEKDGDPDEISVFNDSAPVTTLLPAGGYAAKTATTGGQISTTATRRAPPQDDYVDITRASGDWAAFPEQGWVNIEGSLFLIDEVSSDLATLTVIEKAPGTLSGTANRALDTTAAVRVGSASLPYSQRPSEVHREARYLLAQRNRPQQYRLDLGPEWLTVARGDMFEFESGVASYGLGSGRVLAIEGPATAATGVQMDEELDISGLANPVVKFVTWDGANLLVTRFDIDAANTATLRASKGGDLRWLAFDAAQDLDAIGLVVGGANGSEGAFGEKDLETRELIVREIPMGEEPAGTVLALDHAPEIFDSLLDQAPTPRFVSGITETGLGERARPAVPQAAVTYDAVTSALATITAAAPSGGNQTHTRTAGSFTTDGFTTTHKATTAGYATAGNNVSRVAITASPTTSVLQIANAGGALEAGTGDERIEGVIGTAATTLHIDRAASGVAKLDVSPQGGGVVWVDGPAAGALFASFQSGWVELRHMQVDANAGWWEVTGLRPGNDGLILADPAGTMVSSTGTGQESAHQSQVRRDAGSFVTDGVAANTRVLLEGFTGRDLAGEAFTTRGVLALAVALDDPFGRLAAETGSGDETLTQAQVGFTFELESFVELQNDLRMYVSVPMRPGTKQGVAARTLESRYRLRDRKTGRVTGGWVGIDTVEAGATRHRFGPIPANADFDFASRHLSLRNTPSDWMVLTGNGETDVPAGVIDFTVTSDSVQVEEKRKFALRCEWVPPDASVYTYLLRYSREGDSAWASRILNDRTSHVITDVTIGTYRLQLYVLGANGRPSKPAFALYDFDPHRDFEDVGVLNLRLINHAALPLGIVPVPDPEPTEDPPPQEQ